MHAICQEAQRQGYATLLMLEGLVRGLCVIKAHNGTLNVMLSAFHNSTQEEHTNV